MPDKGQTWWVLIVLCGLLCLGPGIPAAAQEVPLGWQALDGPRGRITHLAAAPDGAVIYAVSVGGARRQNDQTQWRDTGRIYRGDALYRSQDGGTTWQPLTNDLPPGSISALYVDPVTGDLYAGVKGLGDAFTRRYGLWRSADQGAHWEQIALGQNNLDIQRITRSADGHYIYLGVVEAVKYPSSYVYRSADDGRTWTRFQALRYEQSPDSILLDLIPHPADPKLLFITTYGGEVYVSQDAGETWALPGGPPTAGQIHWAGPARLAFDPTDPRKALLVRLPYAGGSDASLVVQRSTDTCTPWHCPPGQVCAALRRECRCGGLTWSDLSATGLPAGAQASAMITLDGGVTLLNTDLGTYRSTDGGVSWQLLEGPLSSGSVAGFISLPGSTTVLAATGYGVFVSRDGGALWQATGAGLPFNSRIDGLLTDPRRPGRVFAIPGREILFDLASPPPVLRSDDAGKSWTPAAQGLPDVALTSWAISPGNPDTLFAGSYEYFFRTDDAGLSWRVVPLKFSGQRAIGVSPADPSVIYLGRRPLLRSADGGETWEDMPILLPGDERQMNDVMGLYVDPANADHVWVALGNQGVYESTDTCTPWHCPPGQVCAALRRECRCGGQSWRAAGLAEQPVNWLIGSYDGTVTLYAGVQGGGIYRLDAPGGDWVAASNGLPEGSTILSLVSDPTTPGTLWANRDGGGVYRSTDRGESWTNVAADVGDNLPLALALDYTTAGSVLMGTATAGVWALRPGESEQGGLAPKAGGPEAGGAVDARVEIVWPHAWAPVTQAKLANIGLRLFRPNSLLPPPCGWTPEVTVWQAVDTEPAEPLGVAEQRSVDGQPFPFWELNDVDVSQANDPAHELYFMVRVTGTETATSVWAHGADPRTYFPQQDVPSGVATGHVNAVDARIQIVWPHDAAGAGKPVTEGTYANVAVALFKHGTRLSVPVGWQPAGLTLYGAWNQEVGRPLAREASVQQRTAGAITYPVWEFDNLPVERATDPANKLYLWVMVDGVETYPTIWTHGADARTFFPAEDEPIQGCVP